MGYTNYWHQHDDISNENWKKIEDEYKKYVLPVAGKHIVDFSDPDTIRFDGGCETFVFSKHSTKEADRRYPEEDLSFHFCKTRAALYDIFVWYLLTYINKIDPSISISRDN
jgi:hypothetical protein